MARPAGFSSDEDDLGEEYYSNTAENLNEKRICIAPDNELKKRSELYINIVNGNVENVLKLIENGGYNINDVLHDNWTPLMLAASVCCEAIVRKLINLGADVNQDKDDYTVLMAACACPNSCVPFANSLEVVKLLIDNGATINSQDRTRMTPLLYAAKAGNIELVEYLLPICDKDAEDNQGWNALFWAVNENHVELVKKLINSGFSPHKTDIRSNTPLVYAIRENNDEVIALLPKEKLKGAAFFENNVYDIEEIFSKIERPKFKSDVNLLLHGMRCENLIPILQKQDLDLLTFLSLTQSKLYVLGVTTPFQQQKILNGLYKFHKHPYKKKSIPVVHKSDPYSTIDLSRAILTTIRQITVMEATFLYLSEQITKENTDNFSNESILLRGIVKKMRTTCLKLKIFAKKCDEEIKPADLITSKSKHLQKNRLNWTCGLAFIGGAIIFAYYYRSKLF